MKPRIFHFYALVLSLTTLPPRTNAAIELDLASQDSIKQAAKQAAAGMTQYYTGYRPGDIPGNLPAPYYWWEAGAMFCSLINYWHLTGDETYNAITTQALLHQVGPGRDFMPPNQTKTLGNDDQAFWAIAALSAAENRYPNPPSDSGVSWLALAQAVFNLQAARWDNTTCGGGLRWQIFAFNSGYNYKNTISNGLFFQMGARLAVYTGNDTYYQLAGRMWDWSSSVGLFDNEYNFFDGSDVLKNCADLDHTQWTYNAGTYLVGAANMYNYTNGGQVWADRLNGIINRLRISFVDGVMYERACEPSGSCNVDQRSFKAYLSRWMAMTIVRAPFTRPLLKPLLERSAIAAAKTCTGGESGNQCGQKWTGGVFDGVTGVGEQMCALEVIQSNLIDYAPRLATMVDGISRGDSLAGTHSAVGPEDLFKQPISAGDKAGAWILTIATIVLVVGTIAWLVTG